jgi:APA family basic amino acid/polyamine antiporter
LVHALAWPETIPQCPIPLPILAGLIAASILTSIHALSHTISGGFQIVSTSFKILIIVGLIALAFLSPGTRINFMPSIAAWTEMASPGFVISLYFVSYAYSGWNASAYIAGEIQNPEKNLSRSLITGTLVVMVLYIALNAAFLWAIPLPDLIGQVDIGLIYTRTIFGSRAGDFLGILIALLLISGMSSMIIAGSRVGQTMANHYPSLQFWAKRNSYGIPVRALLLQWLIIAGYLLTASFDQVILYIGFVLNLFAFLSILGLMIQRYRSGNPSTGYLVPAYPWVPLIFLSFSFWLLVYGLLYRPWESLMGLGVCAVGAVIWLFIRIRK